MKQVVPASGSKIIYPISFSTRVESISATNRHDIIFSSGLWWDHLEARVCKVSAVAPALPYTTQLKEKIKIKISKFL